MNQSLWTNPPPVPNTKLKVKKRVQWDSSTISHLLQEQMKKTCKMTITKVPHKPKTEPVNAHKRLNQLVRRYFPYEVEQTRTEPKHAHTKSTDTDWVSLQNKAYSPNKPDIITVSSEDEESPHMNSDSPKDTPSAIIMDTNFHDGLSGLFGEVSSSEED